VTLFNKFLAVSRREKHNDDMMAMLARTRP